MMEAVPRGGKFLSHGAHGSLLHPVLHIRLISVSPCVNDDCSNDFFPSKCQLILRDYFKENKDAAQTAEDATELIGWILNHLKVHDIFDTMQREVTQNALKQYLVANLTCWTTHSIALGWLLSLKESLHCAAYLHHDDIITAQVGAEKNAKVKAKLTATAESQCNLIESPSFWMKLKQLVDEIEPITFAVNITQQESAQPDHVLLALGGLYLHFSQLSDARVAWGMKKCLEKHWAAQDQSLFIFALILNPFEKLKHFRDQSNVLQFTLLNIFKEVCVLKYINYCFPMYHFFLKLYEHVQARPPRARKPACSEGEKDAKTNQVFQGFLEYLSCTGEFKAFEENKEVYLKSIVCYFIISVCISYSLY
jgi:hypothetical protein